MPDLRVNLNRPYCTDVDVLVQKSREAFLDGSAVDHEKWSVVSCCSNHYARHVFVTAWN